jgi:hypothetical protein
MMYRLDARAIWLLGLAVWISQCSGQLVGFLSLLAGLVLAWAVLS